MSNIETATNETAVDVPANIEPANEVATEGTSPDSDSVESTTPPVDKDATIRKLENAIRWRERKAAKQEESFKKEIEALRTEMQNFRGGNQSAKQDGPPRIEDFETYEEYNDAKLEYKLSKFTQENSEKAQKEKVNFEKNQRYEKQDEVMSQEIDSLVAENPEVQKLILENTEIIQALPEEIISISYDLQEAGINSVHGFLQLAKEGVLDKVLSLSGHSAAAVIASAAERAKALGSFKPKPISNAPSPMVGVRGNSPAKSESNMSGAELRKKYGFKN